MVWISRKHDRRHRRQYAEGRATHTAISKAYIVGPFQWMLIPFLVHRLRQFEIDVCETTIRCLSTVTIWKSEFHKMRLGRFVLKPHQAEASVQLPIGSASGSGCEKDAGTATTFSPPFLHRDMFPRRAASAQRARRGTFSNPVLHGLVAGPKSKALHNAWQRMDRMACNQPVCSSLAP